MKLSKSLALVFSISLLLFISACDSGGGSGSSDSVGTGILDVSLTDSAGSYKAVYITIEGVEVHTGGNDNNKNNWQTIPMDLNTINLCELTNGVFEKLGSLSLSSGKYTQLRLVLTDTPEDNELNILSELHPAANYVVLDDNSWHELKIPSGFQSGVKIVKGFTINEDKTTEILLDFDASRSVVEAGNSGQWLLKPTIKALKDYSIINGMVTNNEDEGIANAKVSVQKYDAKAQDDKDKVIVQAATITDSDGSYSIFVKPGIYNLVAFADGKEIASERIETSEGEILENSDITDFQLADASEIGTIEGKVLINGANDNEQYATISYRKEVGCPECEMIEVKSINVLNMAEYEIELPTGSYSRVASTFGGYDTQTAGINVVAGTNTDDIEF
jgi:hypothetical protein